MGGGGYGGGDDDDHGEGVDGETGVHRTLIEKDRDRNVIVMN